MNCGMECIKYILFIFNFIFALGGLCLLGLAVSAYVGYTSEMQEVIGADLTINGPLVTLMIAGAVIFIIAFFGCCGAIRESHCMIVTFAVCIMTLLAIQIGVSIWIFKIAGVDNAKESLGKAISTSMANYKTNKQSEEFMNVIQTLAQCCGDTSSRDYTSRTIEIPYSCCGKPQGTTCNNSGDIYQKGCREGLPEAFNKYAKLIATSALVVAGVEVVGIIFSLCLASSISNAERRGYKV